MQESFEIDESIRSLADKAEKACAEQFLEIDKTVRQNSEKVLYSFIKNRVSEASLKGTNGYGYGDVGRDTTDRVYADAFGAEDALVRHTFVNGTHALSTALFGVLRPNDTLLCVTGKPYDTLEEVIGLAGEKGKGSLIDFGVKYDEVDLLKDGTPDYEGIAKKAKSAKVIYIQRSRGYSLRPSLDVDTIGKIISCAKDENPSAIAIVDNCYGEFAEVKEPTSVGANLIVGSLIKNPGGGIAQTGGYIAGDKELVNMCADRLTCVGMGKEVGCSLSMTREILLGFFLAPQTVGEALKTSVFACRFFELLGFETLPKASEKRTDIIASVLLKNEENLTAFCQGIQKGSPIDSFVTPEAWDMPGYDSKVIMAAGTFTMGASIELSADAPIREPYAAWLQGGITYPTGRLGVMLAAEEMRKKGYIKL
ncbi:MAG: methionine gamma-lyase family protein [Ruminococcus sp.]|nr:methionine gamma-lyase family protein [Ruminococcus sp.]